MIERAELLPGARDDSSSDVIVRKLAWKRVLEARGTKSKSSDSRESLARRFPDSAVVVERYLAARAKCHTDGERREANRRFLAPHCEALATRSLAAMRGNRQLSVRDRHAILARMRALNASRQARA
jgi:hypothetical protein